MDRESIEEAIEVLEDASADMLMETGEKNYYSEAIAILRQALKTEQKPVAWASSLDFDDDNQEIIPAKAKGKLGTSNCDIPLYTAPPKQWVGLTDEELDNATRKQVDDLLDHIYEYGTAVEGVDYRIRAIARAIEAKLKEKNHG